MVGLKGPLVVPGQPFRGGLAHLAGMCLKSVQVIKGIDPVEVTGMIRLMNRTPI